MKPNLLASSAILNISTLVPRPTQVLGGGVGGGRVSHHLCPSMCEIARSAYNLSGTCKHAAPNHQKAEGKVGWIYLRWSSCQRERWEAVLPSSPAAQEGDRVTAWIAGLYGTDDPNHHLLCAYGELGWWQLHLNNKGLILHQQCWWNLCYWLQWTQDWALPLG